MKKIKEFFDKLIRNLMKYSKFIFPLIALVLTAVVVVLALDYRKKAEEKREIQRQEEIAAQQIVQVLPVEEIEVPLETSSDEKIKELFDRYYQALSEGDSETLNAICHNLDISESIRLTELAKYLTYSVKDIYIQDGREADTYISYVYGYVIFNEYPELSLPSYSGFYICTDEVGELYIEKGDLSDEVNEYIDMVASQDDVVELNNKITVEYNDVVRDNPDILNYLIDLDTKVSLARGEKLAELNASEPDTETEVSTDGNDEQHIDDIPLEEQTKYATAKTSVNVRKSDSANSDRLGEVSQGQKLEVIEEQLNGWTKVIYNGQEAFIKSEYLSMIQSASGVPTIGLMTAKDNVNVRSEANTTSERLGALVTGDQYEIAAIEDGWVTIKYDGYLAFVSQEYCDCTIFEDNGTGN